jgi:hypothetical protein
MIIGKRDTKLALALLLMLALLIVAAVGDSYLARRRALELQGKAERAVYCAIWNREPNCLEQKKGEEK